MKIVANGGYITSIFQRVARTHFKNTHPTLHNGEPDIITLHLTFIRRTEVGPATFHVQDTKLGSRTSTLHIILSQQNTDNSVRDEVAGYITVSNMATESGPSMPVLKLNSKLQSPPQSKGNQRGAVKPHELAYEGHDGGWEPLQLQLTSMRKTSHHVEVYVPKENNMAPRTGYIEQWVRFKPYGQYTMWTNDAVGFLCDTFPAMLQTWDKQPWLNDKDPQKGEKKVFWYPTILLNIEFKKRLPPGGVEGLYTCVQAKMLEKGRMDFNISILDEHGDIVALSNHVCLIVDASRNLSVRKGREGESKI